MTKFEKLTKERQEEIIEEHREINTEYNWWEYSLDDIAEQIKDKVDIELKGVDLMFDFFSKGHSGVQTDRSSIFSALSDKYNNLEDLDISEEFGVWAYIGLNRDNTDDVVLLEEYEDEYKEDDDLTKLLQDKQDEEDKENIKNDLDEVLDIFAKGYRDLEDEYNYLTSDKGIIETFEANKMEFENED